MVASKSRAMRSWSTWRPPSTILRPATYTSRSADVLVANTSASSWWLAGTPSKPGVCTSSTSASARAPRVSPHMRWPAAEPPACSAVSNRRAAVAGCCVGAAATLRCCRRRRWPYSSQRNSSAHWRLTWLSDPTAMGTPAASQAGRSAKPSPRLPSVLGQMTMPAPLRATASISACSVCVACTSCQRASKGQRWHSHAIGRWPVAARQSRTSCICSATWMWMGMSVSPTWASRVSMDLAEAARSEWMARPAFTSGRPLACTVACSRAIKSGVPAKRRWSGRNAGWAKPARSYSTGSTVRPRPASAAASVTAQAMVASSA